MEYQHNVIGAATVATNLYEGASRFHAQIGTNVDQVTLKRLRDRLHKQAQQCCYEKKWEEALNTFLQVLALSEKLPPTGDEGYRGILIHNIGFCLHCLGELDAAKGQPPCCPSATTSIPPRQGPIPPQSPLIQAYYEQSIEALEKERAATPLTKRLLHNLLYPEQAVLGLINGDAHSNRVRMTKERLVDIAFGWRRRLRT